MPVGWDRVAIKWVTKVYAGGTPDRSNSDYWTNGDVPWLNSGSVNDWVIDRPSEMITKDAVTAGTTRWVPAQSVVIALAGQGRTKGMAARLEIATTCNQSMAAIVPGPKVDYRYLHYWLHANYQSIRNLAGGDKRDGLNLDHVGSIEMPLPSTLEQRTVADYLDRETDQIDALIRKQERLIETLRERRIATIAKAVTKGIDGDVGLVGTPSDWLGLMPSHWKIKRLKNALASTQTGVWGGEPQGDEADVLCVRVADFDRPRLRVIDDVPTVRSVQPTDLEPRLLRAGDLLLEKSGGTSVNPVGFVAIFGGTDRPAVSSNFISRIRLRDGQVPRYWLYSFAASYATKLTARSVKQTTGIQNLDQASLFNELFPFPPTGEQSAIADYLDEQTTKVDELISKVEQFIALAKERRSALITAAVTGQIDVRAAS